MKLHNATVKFQPKQYDGKYGPYLQSKVTLPTGQDVPIYENDSGNQAFLLLYKGQKIQVIEDVGKDGKPKYKPVLEENTAIQPHTTGKSTISTSPSERLDQLLDCFGEILIRVEARFPSRYPEDQRAIATTMMIQLEKEYGQALGIATQPPNLVAYDPHKPWTSWKSPNDAIAWAVGELPNRDVSELQSAFAELSQSNGKKAKAWTEWVKKQKCLSIGRAPRTLNQY